MLVLGLDLMVLVLDVGALALPGACILVCVDVISVLIPKLPWTMGVDGLMWSSGWSISSNPIIHDQQNST